MNRVDEALRRAATLTTATATREQDNTPITAPLRGPLSLELYPAEVARRAEAFAPEPALRVIEPPIDVLAEERPAAIRVGRSYENKLVFGDGASPFAMEQYRRLAAAVHRHQIDQGLNRLMVSSAVPGEGKTLTIVNLAMTLSGSYQRRVLLIDADLRRPSIHEVFGIANDEGLCDVLRSNSGEVPIAEVSPHLSVLPAGELRGDPLTVLASERMEELLQDLHTQFDWILLDAPPVALMADAAQLVHHTRAVILVIGAGSTPYSVVEKAVAELGRANIIGTVLNRIEDSGASWSEYYANVPAGRARTPTKALQRR